MQRATKWNSFSHFFLHKPPAFAYWTRSQSTTHRRRAILKTMFQPEEARALVLSTLAGAATGIGGLLAVLHRPDAAMLAALLGLAIGVMTTLSIGEMIVHNAYQHGATEVLIWAAIGFGIFRLLSPLLPKSEPVDLLREDKKGNAGQSKAHLMRLGVLMTITLTLHNMPEGLAVAFASYTTNLGPLMCLSIAAHNIPEGLIIAAPIYAATGNRSKAFTLALLSGMTEPLGALIGVLLARPFMVEKALQDILAVVGGVMFSVCVFELWPEARNCRRDDMVALGFVGGSLVIVATLLFGV